MHSSEACACFSQGCADHGRPDCLCDVAPLESGVPIRAVPDAQRLLELGVSRLGLAIWAGELTARRLRLVKA